MGPVNVFSFIQLSNFRIDLPILVLIPAADPDIAICIPHNSSPLILLLQLCGEFTDYGSDNGIYFVCLKIL